MVWPGGRSRRSTWAVKSESSSAAGPVTRRTSAKDSVVDHSRKSRASRSVRDQTTARAPSFGVGSTTSPTCAPQATLGRTPAARVRAGATAKAAAEPRNRRLLIAGRGS